MRTLLLFLLLCFGVPYAVSQPNLQPLNEQEQRQVLLQLNELGDLRERVRLYEDFFAKLEEQYKTSVEKMQELIEMEKQLAEIRLKAKDDEIALLREKADLYEKMYKAVTKRGMTVGCFFKKVFTLWQAGC